jgi:hypothetical protein
MSYLTCRGRRALTAGLLAAAAALAAGAAPAGATTGAPVWLCRASALWISLSDMNRTEPVLANGNPNTASGVSPDRAQCADDETGGENQGSPFGSPPSFTTKTLAAKTTITPELGQPIDQSIASTAKVEDLHYQPDPAGPVQFGVGAAQSDAAGKCVNGQPTYSGTSKVTNLTLGGQSVSADQLLDGLSKALAPLGDVVELKINEQVPSADGLIVRALHLKVFRKAGPSMTPIVDLIVAETKVGNSGEVCNPNAQVPRIFVSNGRVGSSSGPAATCGRITMYFVRGHKHSVTSRFGTRQVTRGRLVTCSSKPRSIVGAKIDVYHIIRGHRRLVKTGLKSRPGGKLTLILPLNLTTRTIEFDYRPDLASSAISSRVTLHLTVRNRRGRLVR